MANLICALQKALRVGDDGALKPEALSEISGRFHALTTAAGFLPRLKQSFLDGSADYRGLSDLSRQNR
jgi:hypothetical protein